MKKMYRLRIETEFDAAHNLKGYLGKCANLHGHTWKVVVFVVGNKLDSIGMVVDFGILKNNLKEVTEGLDHTYLNDKSEVGNPTSENIAKYIFEQMKNLPKGVRLERVRVWESPRSWCEYSE
jgi:6-pyruvoyltetrahydropterin/6-carboxytetrahydropterin synthase